MDGSKTIRILKSDWISCSTWGTQIDIFVGSLYTSSSGSVKSSHCGTASWADRCKSPLFTLLSDFLFCGLPLSMAPCDGMLECRMHLNICNIPASKWLDSLGFGISLGEDQKIAWNYNILWFRKCSLRTSSGHSFPNDRIMASAIRLVN